MNSNLKSDKRTLFAYAAATCLACVLLASHAYAADQGPSETVKFADLNLSTQAGAEALYSRIHAAARRVCKQPSGLERAVIPCMTKAESEAIAKVDAPLLTAYYQKQTGSHPATLTAKR